MYAASHALAFLVQTVEKVFIYSIQSSFTVISISIIIKDFLYVVYVLQYSCTLLRSRCFFTLKLSLSGSITDCSTQKDGRDPL